MYRIVLMGLLMAALGMGGTFSQGAEDPAAEIAQLKAQVAELQKRVEELERLVAPLRQKIDGEQQREALQKQARERMQKDLEVYREEELTQIEALYQVANRQWKTPEARQSLQELISKYKNANRTGCAVLYLGQMTPGAEGEQYLKLAMQDYSDCFYGDGVQVGAYARFCLAHRNVQEQNYEEAAQLLDEIEKTYPNAIDHQGRPLAGAIADLRAKLKQE